MKYLVTFSVSFEVGESRAQYTSGRVPSSLFRYSSWEIMSQDSRRDHWDLWACMVVNNWLGFS